MRVLVTGALGYVGRAVILELLGAGHEVVGVRRGTESQDLPPASGLDIVTADLLDAARVGELVRACGVDAIVHLAALARAREAADFTGVNVDGTRNVLRAAGQLPRSPVVVLASSAQVYGSGHSAPVAEDVQPTPDSPYAESKLAAERLVASHGGGGAILRIFNVGGAVAGVADPDRSRIIPAVLSVAAGERPSITLSGDGTSVRDFVHLSDVAGAVRAAVEQAHPGACPVYNVGSGVGSRLLDVVRYAEEVTGRRIGVEHTAQDAPPGLLVADVTLARKELGWEPVRSDLRTIVADAWACWPVRP